MLTLINSQTLKKLNLSGKDTIDVFGKDSDGKKFICIPYHGGIPVKVEIKNEIQKKKLKGTCVIRMGGIGDLILLSSGLRELKKRMNKEPLIFATLKNNIDFMRDLGIVNKVIDIDDLEGYKFDKVIDLRFSVEPPELGKTCKGTWESYTTEDRSDAFDKLLGVYPCPKRFVVPEHKKTTSKMKRYIGDGFILVCASMVASARSIPPVYIKPLCQKILRKLKKSVVLIGQSQPWNKNLVNISGEGITNLIDKTSLNEMISLCKLANVVVTPDTGTLHVAGALGTKTLGIFGNINPRTRVSYYKNVKTLYSHGVLSCLPCWDLHPCHWKHDRGVECMRLITPDMIVNELEAMC